MIERIYIKEIALEFGYKDNRSVKRWCRNNGVKIFSDIGCKFQYVIQVEFEAAKTREYIKYLKEKYGNENFREVLNASTNVIEEMTNDQNSPDTHYQPHGKKEKNFLATLLKIKPK